MRKTLAAAVTSLAILLTIGTGNAFADTSNKSTLDTVVSSVYGTPYKTGGLSKSGFDCSGFTQYVFKRMDVELPRVANAQYKQGTSISKSQLKEGDLVFFDTLGKGVSHVGIYIGDGKFAHASSSKGIHIDKLSNSYYQKNYVGAKRVLTKQSYQTYAI